MILDEFKHKYMKLGLTKGTKSLFSNIFIKRVFFSIHRVEKGVSPYFLGKIAQNNPLFCVFYAKHSENSSIILSIDDKNHVFLSMYAQIQLLVTSFCLFVLNIAKIHVFYTSKMIKYSDTSDRYYATGFIVVIQAG